MSKPCVIIRTLEDSPTRLDQQLVTAYLTTRYWVGWPDTQGCFLGIGEASAAFTQYLEHEKIDSFAIITAHNPRSESLSILENECRNQALEQDLKQHTTLLWPANNISLDDSWPEEASLCVAGLSQITAIELGRQYGQNAIVWWEKNEQVSLLWLVAEALDLTTYNGDE